MAHLGDNIFAGTLSGSLVALKAKTGEVLWTHTPLVSPPVELFPGFELPLDSVWGGPISVRNMIVYALAPNDEFGLPAVGRGAVLAEDSNVFCVFSAPDTELFSPIHIGGMVVVRGAQDGTLYVVDFQDCGLITSLSLPSGPSGGANLSISNGSDLHWRRILWSGRTNCN